MIEVDSLYKRLSGKPILRGVSFEVLRGKITGLIGPNGSGKTTTIRILTGYYAADSGSVRVGGHRMTLDAVQAKRLIGYAPENAPAYGEQTVREYLAFIAAVRGFSRADYKNEVDRVAERFSLREVQHQLVGTLSKGFRHRLALAQSLIGDPPILILDEPTDGLDPIQKIETRDIIARLAESKAILLTTHLLEEVDSLCDRLVVIEQGQVVASGTLQEIRSAPPAGSLASALRASPAARA